MTQRGTDSVIRYTVFHLDSARRRRAEDGALIIPGRLARTGVQNYDQGGGQMLAEYRPPEEVFDDAAIASFNGLTITDQHPPSGRVTPDSFRNVTIGHIQNPRREGDWLIVDHFIKDADAIRRVEDGKLVELSAGYVARLDMAPGVLPDGTRYDAVQRSIRGNHAALLPQGHARAGREARLLDSNKNEVVSPPGELNNDEKPPSGEKRRRMDEFKVTIGGIEYTLQGDSAARQAISQYADALSQAKSQVDVEKARADEAEAKAKGLEVELKDATDPETLAERVEARQRLLDSARAVAGKAIDATGSDRDIMIRALCIDGIEKRSDDYVRARFDARLETASSTPPTAAASRVVDSIIATTPKRPQRFARLAQARARALGGN